jgi:hypothetical protein
MKRVDRVDVVEGCCEEVIFFGLRVRCCLRFCVFVWCGVIDDLVVALRPMRGRLMRSDVI